MDIQQGRDNGLPPYHQYLEFCDSSKKNISEWNHLIPIISPEVIIFINYIYVQSFANVINKINCILQNIERLKMFYSSVKDIDILVGIFLETKINYMGPVARCIISKQLYRSRYGDRYFYDHKFRPNPFTEGQYFYYF